MQHCADMLSRNQNLCGQANATKHWEPVCFITLGLTRTCPRLSHLYRKSYSTFSFWFFFFRLACIGLFTPVNCLEPVSLISFKESVRVDKYMQAASSSKTPDFYHFRKPQHFCCLQDFLTVLILLNKLLKKCPDNLKLFSRMVS